MQKDFSMEVIGYVGKDYTPSEQLKGSTYCKDAWAEFTRLTDEDKKSLNKFRRINGLRTMEGKFNNED